MDAYAALPRIKASRNSSKGLGVVAYAALPRIRASKNSPRVWKWTVMTAVAIVSH